MQQGKIFETIVQIIQETLKDSPKTVVHQDYKLKDNAGLERQIDVLIQSEINNFSITIAIECKDYKRKIGVDKIESFQAKCNDIPQINKKIFVSRAGYQSGAIAKGKLYGIELLLLEKIDKTQISKWFNIGEFTPISIERTLSSPKIKIEDSTIILSTNDIISFEKEGIKTTIFEHIKLVVKAALPKNNIITHPANIPIGQSKKISFRIDFEDTFILKENKKYKVISIIFDVLETYVKLEKEEYIDRYSGSASDTEIVESVTNITKYQDVLSFVKNKNKPEIDLVSKVRIEGEERLMKIGEMKIEKTD